MSLNHLQLSIMHLYARKSSYQDACKLLEGTEVLKLHV